MRNRIATLVALLFCISCGNNDGQQTKEISNVEVITKEGFVVEEGVEHGEYQRYIGTIAGQPVVLNLVTIGDNMTAQYYYEKVGINISLFKSVDSTLGEGEMSFTEYPPEPTDEPARWRITMSGDSISGVWENFSNSTHV